jgi:hypothetical protein
MPTENRINLLITLFVLKLNIDLNDCNITKIGINNLLIIKGMLLF